MFNNNCSAVAVWVITVITVLFTVIPMAIGVVISITCCCIYKHRKQVPNDPNRLGPVYEEPDDLKPDPHTEGNLAYGHVQHTGRQQSSQPPTELRGQVYEEPENFKPDAHTQGNVAYGQVQFTQ